MRIKRSPSEGLANGGASQTGGAWAWRSMALVVNGAHATHSQAIDRSRHMLNAPQRQAILMTRSALLLVFLAPSLAFAQQGDGTDVQANVHTFKPAKVDATPERVQALTVPSGFQVRPLAQGLQNPRIIAVGPDGRIYVSRRDQGDVLLLEDANEDGALDAEPKVVFSRPGAHGLAIANGQLYVATANDACIAPPYARTARWVQRNGSSTTCRMAASTPTARWPLAPMGCSTSAWARPVTRATRLIPSMRRC